MYLTNLQLYTPNNLYFFYKMCSKETVLIYVSTILYICGRGLDQANRHRFQNVNPNMLEGWSLASLGLSTILIIILRCFQEGSLGIASLKFLTNWLLCIISVIYIFFTFGCHSDGNDILSTTSSLSNCIMYLFVLLLTNFINSTACHEKAEQGFIIVVIIFLIGESIHHAVILPRFLKQLQLKDTQKYHSIFFTLIMIVWKGFSMQTIIFSKDTHLGR